MGQVLVVGVLKFSTKNNLLYLVSRIWIKVHFLLASQELIFAKLLFKSLAELAQNIEMYHKQINNFEFNAKSSDKSLINISKNNVPSTEPFRTAALITTQEQF